jgi:hypothetical protein
MRTESQKQPWKVRIADLPILIEYEGRTGKIAYFEIRASKNGLGMMMNGIDERILDQLGIARRPK